MLQRLLGRLPESLRPHARVAVLGFAAFFAVVTFMVALDALSKLVPAAHDDQVGLAFGLLSIPFGLALLALWVGAPISLVAILVAVLRKHTPTPGLLALPSALLALLTFVLVLWVLPLGGSLPRSSDRRPFDARVWQAETEVRAGVRVSPRQEMLRDLVSRALPGKSRDEVVALLGPPSEYDPFGGGDWGLIYRTGLQRGSLFNIDDEWLLLWFDRDGRFRRWEVRSD